jgi:hypothetical protein
MATNKLMEAAAEILATSKSSAPGMPMSKLQHDTPGNSGTPEDLGGPTPQNSKATDDSNKVSNKASAKSASAPTTKPSAASPDTQNHVGKNTMHEDEEYDEEGQLNELSNSTLKSYIKKAGSQAADSKQELDHLKRSPDAGDRAMARDAGKNYVKRTIGTFQASNKLRENEYHEDNSLIEELRAQMHEDMQALFSDDETISEDFKIKAATIFEARVFDRVAQIQEQIEEEYAGQLVEAVEIIKQELTEKVDDYLNYVVEQWMDDNEIAVESGLRSEITEDFIAGLRNLFAENYINVPEDKVDLVEELASKVEELEEKLNEEIETNVQYKKQLTEAVKVQLVNEVCEGLTATQVEKIKSLAESVEFSTEEEFVEKLETIRENYFPSGMKKAYAAQLHETVDDTDGTDKKVSSDPYVASVMQAISKTKI